MNSAPGDAWDEVPIGQLCDRYLKQVRDGVATRDAGDVLVQYSSIVLHVGEVVWRISGQGVRPERLDTRGATVIQPGELVSIVTDERLTLPAFVSGKIFSKGRMPSLGLLGTSTTIDPGFDNYLHVTVVNVGGASVRLPRGLAIAKVELVRLPSPVERPYVSREDPKTNLPRDDYLFAGRPLVDVSSRLETLAEAQRRYEERLAQLEACIAQNARRQRRIVAMLIQLVLLVATASLALVLSRSVVSVTDAQARTLWTNVMAGVVLAAALAIAGMAARAKGRFWEWLGGVHTSPTPPGAMPVCDQDERPSEASVPKAR
jgi:hypothetical protein